jgi:hypothetical protein
LVLSQELVDTGADGVQAQRTRDLDLLAVQVDSDGLNVFPVAEEVEELAAATPDVQNRRRAALRQPPFGVPGIVGDSLLVLGFRDVGPNLSPRSL